MPKRASTYMLFAVSPSVAPGFLSQPRCRPTGRGWHVMQASLGPRSKAKQGLVGLGIVYCTHFRRERGVRETGQKHAPQAQWHGLVVGVWGRR